MNVQEIYRLEGRISRLLEVKHPGQCWAVDGNEQLTLFIGPGGFFWASEVLRFMGPISAFHDVIRLYAEISTEYGVYKDQTTEAADNYIKEHEPVLVENLIGALQRILIQIDPEQK